MRRRADEPDPLGRSWDDLLDAEPLGGERAGRPEPPGAEIVRGLHAMDDTPGPPPDLVRRMWADALRQAATAPAGVPAARNGHHAIHTVQAGAERRAGLARLVMTILAGLAAGFVAGAVVGGLGARAIMRLAGALTTDQNRGLLTEAGNSVGKMSLGGTLSLLMFGGFLGALAAMLYLAIRRLLPWDGWRRGLLFGAIIFALGGPDILERGANPDYQRFGIAGLNVCLFSVLPVLYGLALAPLADRWTRRAAGWQPTSRLGWVAPVALAPLLVVAGIAMVVGLAGAPLLLLLFAPGAAWTIARRWPDVLARMPSLPRPLLQAATYGAVALPCLVGLVQIAISIERILG